MTTRVLPIPAVTRASRPRVLGPILAGLREARVEPSSPTRNDGMVALHFLGRRLTVDLWTKSRLDQYFRSGAAASADCARMVAQSVALLAKCESDLDRLEHYEALATGDLYKAQAKLMLDAAMGQSLVGDIQRVIDDLLKRGGLEEARNLTDFRNRLRNAVSDVRRRVAVEYRSALEVLADRMTESAVVDAPAGRDSREESSPNTSKESDPAPLRARAPAPTPLHYPQRHPREHPPRRRSGETRRGRHAPATATHPASPRTGDGDAPRGGVTGDKSDAARSEVGQSAGWWRTGLLTAMLVLTLLPLAMSRRSDSPAARAERTPVSAGAGAVQEVRDRWPSLYVIVDPEAWEGLSEPGRLELVDGLVSSMAPDRYTGALVATEDGRPLAQWLLAGGVSLLDHGAERGPSRTAVAGHGARGARKDGPNHHRSANH